MLYARARGGDEFISFDEAVAFDDAARTHTARAGSACAWPSKLMRGDSCWQRASDGGMKELVEADICMFLQCRARLGSPSVACLAAACTA